MTLELGIRQAVHTLRFETFGIPPLPLLVTCVADDDVQDVKTSSLLLHAPSIGFSPQEVRILISTGRIPGCVCFLTSGKQQTSSFAS